MHGERLVWSAMSVATTYLSQDSVQIGITQFCQLSKRLWALKDSAADLCWDSFSQEQELVFVGIQFRSQHVEQTLRRCVPIIEPPVFDLAQVREADSYLLS